MAELAIASCQKMPTPLNEAQDRHLKRAMACVQQWHVAFDQWIQFRDEFYRSKIRESGDMDQIGRLMHRMQSLEARGLRGHELAPFFSKADEALVRQMDLQRDEASEKLRVVKPDWTVPTTDALAAEVNAYIDRVWDVAKRAGLVDDSPPPAATQPATTRSVPSAQRKRLSPPARAVQSPVRVSVPRAIRPGASPRKR